MIKIPEPTTPLQLPMPWRRLRYNLECIGWTQGEASRRLRIDDSTLRQMCTGKRPIPDKVAIWTETLVAIHRALPEPHEWTPTGKWSDPSNYPMPEFDPDPEPGRAFWLKHDRADLPRAVEMAEGE
jgi:hypothetical protein